MTWNALSKATRFRNSLIIECTDSESSKELRLLSVKHAYCIYFFFGMDYGSRATLASAAVFCGRLRLPAPVWLCSGGHLYLWYCQFELNHAKPRVMSPYCLVLDWKKGPVVPIATPKTPRHGHSGFLPAKTCRERRWQWEFVLVWLKVGITIGDRKWLWWARLSDVDLNYPNLGLIY